MSTDDEKGSDHAEDSGAESPENEGPSVIYRNGSIFG
jgi:hypothetical protein